MLFQGDERIIYLSSPYIIEDNMVNREAKLLYELRDKLKQAEIMGITFDKQLVSELIYDIDKKIDKSENDYISKLIREYEKTDD